MSTISKNSLVLYKNRPALVKQTGEKLALELEGEKAVMVRPKDVILLHPGPVQSLRDLQPQTGEVNVASELLAGETSTLMELAELIYETFTPATAWAAWQLVEDGLYFRGNPEEIVARVAPPEKVEEELEKPIEEKVEDIERVEGKKEKEEAVEEKAEEAKPEEKKEEKQ